MPESSSPPRRPSTIITTGAPWSDLSSLVQFLQGLIPNVRQHVFAGNATESQCRVVIADRLGVSPHSMERILTMTYEGREITALSVEFVNKVIALGWRCTPESLKELEGLWAKPAPRPSTPKPAHKRRGLVRPPQPSKRLTGDFLLNDPWKGHKVFVDAVLAIRRDLKGEYRKTQWFLKEILGLSNSVYHKLWAGYGSEILPVPEGGTRQFYINYHPSNAMAEHLERKLNLPAGALDRPEDNAPAGRRFVLKFNAGATAPTPKTPEPKAIEPKAPVAEPLPVWAAPVEAQTPVAPPVRVATPKTPAPQPTLNGFREIILGHVDAASRRLHVLGITDSELLQSVNSIRVETIQCTH